MAPGTTAKPRKLLRVDPSQGQPTVWVTLHGGYQHMAFLLDQAEDGRKLVRWATNSATEWLGATVPVSSELPSRRSRQRASRDGGEGRTLRQRQPSRKSRAGAAKAPPPHDPEIAAVAAVDEQGRGTGDTKDIADSTEFTENPAKETQKLSQQRKRHSWRDDASSEEEEFEFDDNNEEDESYKDSEDEGLSSEAEHDLSDEEYTESSTRRSKKKKRSTKRRSIVRERRKRRRVEKSMDEEVIESSVVENNDKGVEDLAENVQLGRTVPGDEVSQVDKASEISGRVKTAEKYANNNEVESKDDRDNTINPVNQTDEPNVLEATATDVADDPKEHVQDGVLVDDLLDKDQETNKTETMLAAADAPAKNSMTFAHNDMPTDNNTLSLEKVVIIQETPAIGLTSVAEDTGNHWVINDALSLSTDGLPVDQETMIASPSGDVDDAGIILGNEKTVLDPILHDDANGGDDSPPLDNTAENVAITTAEVEVGDFDFGIANGQLVLNSKIPVDIQAEAHEGTALPALDTSDTGSVDIGSSFSKSLEKKHDREESAPNYDAEATKDTRNEALAGGIQVDPEQEISAGGTLAGAVSRNTDGAPPANGTPIDKENASTEKGKVTLADTADMGGVYDYAFSKDIPRVGSDKNGILLGREHDIQETTPVTAIIPSESTGDVESGTSGLSVGDILVEKHCVGTSVTVRADQEPPVNDAIPGHKNKNSDDKIEPSDRSSDDKASQSKSAAAITEQSNVIHEHDRVPDGKLNSHPRNEKSPKEDSESMSVNKVKQSAGQSTESENVISKLVVLSPPENSEPMSKDSNVAPSVTEIEQRRVVLPSKMTEASKETPVQQQVKPPNADKDLLADSVRIEDKDIVTKASASKPGSVIIGRMERQAPTDGNQFRADDTPTIVIRPGGESNWSREEEMERRVQLETDLDNATEPATAVAAKKGAARGGVLPLRKNVVRETVLPPARPGTTLSKSKKKRKLWDSFAETCDTSECQTGDMAPAKYSRSHKSQRGTGSRSTIEVRHREPPGRPRAAALAMETGVRLSTTTKIAANQNTQTRGFGFETKAAPIIPTNTANVPSRAWNLETRLQMTLQSNNLLPFLLSQTRAPEDPPSFTGQFGNNAVGAATSLTQQRVPLPPRNPVEIALQQRSCGGGAHAVYFPLGPSSGRSSADCGQEHPSSSSSLLASTIFQNRNRSANASARDPPGRVRRKKQA